MSETAEAHGEAVRREKKKARRRPDDGTEFCGVRRTRGGKYGAQIRDGLRRIDVWLGTFDTAEEAAEAFDAAAVELRGAAKSSFKIPAAVIQTSASVTVVKAESAEEQGLSPGQCGIAEEHGDGMEAVERRALPNAQAKFENAHKYYYKRRRKDSRAGCNDGKKLGALHGTAGAASPVAPPATAVALPGIVGPSTFRALAEPPHVGATAGMATPVVGANLSFSTSITEDYSDDEGTDDMGGRAKRKRTSVPSVLLSDGGAAAGVASGEIMRFLEGLANQVMERQEAMQRRFLEAIEKREQEMARLAREQEILSQERAAAATRDAAVLSLIQKITGQSIPMPSSAASPIRFMSAPPPSSQLPASTQPQKPTASGSGGGCGGATSSSRWLNAEVQALIQLRSNLDDMRRKGLRRGPLWEEISAGMRRMGYSRSCKQCKKKWEKMNNSFKKVKERPEYSKTLPYFHLLEELYRNKAALGSPAGAGGAAVEHANAVPRDPIQAFTVVVPISQTAMKPHTLPPVSKNGVTKNDGNGHE